MRNFAETVDDLDLIDRVDARTQAAVYTKDLIVNDTAQRKVVEHVGEIVPDRRVAVFSGTLRVKAVRLGNTSALMVTSDEVDSIGISELETDQKADGLDTEQPAINIVACDVCQSRSDTPSPSPLSCAFFFLLA